MSAKKILGEILELDNKILELRDQFDELPEDEQSEALSSFFSDTLRKTGALDPLPMALVRATDMVSSLDNGAGILAEGLSHPNQDIRQLSGEAIITVGEDGIEAILPAIDHALEAGGSAAEEMPFVLTYLDDPSVTGQICRFLEHDSADVVASAIEALAEVGDPDAIDSLKKWTDDERTINVDEEEAENQTITVGLLAKEAIEMLQDNEG